MDHDDKTNDDDKTNEVPRNEYIDKITIELLMSKSKYNKYLESKYPEKYEENILYKKEVVLYKSIIQDIIDEEFANISSGKNGRSTELKRYFDAFLKECVRYVKMKELEIENPFNHKNYDDDETIFENCDNVEQKIKDIYTTSSNFQIDSSDDEEITNKNNHSLWGEGAIKYDMKMFARKRR